MGSDNKKVGILVMAGEPQPTLHVLDSLPPSANIIGVGADLQDLSGVSEEQWGQVEVLLSTGLGVRKSQSDILKELWPRLTGLKWIHLASAGVEHILFPELVDSNVTVTNAKGTFSGSLAEYAIAACMWFAKRLPELWANQCASKWTKLTVEELRGKTMGVIGYGDIGQASARLGRAHGMRIIALRRRTELSGEEQQQGLEVHPPEQLNLVMASSDYIVMALPGTPATVKLVGKEAIAAMKPTGVLINLGRGKTLDEAALVEALQEGRIRGAALDVFENEPLPDDSPLWGEGLKDRVLLSPHCADLTPTFMEEALEQFVDNVKRYAAGKPLCNVVDKQAGY